MTHHHCGQDARLCPWGARRASSLNPRGMCQIVFLLGYVFLSFLLWRFLEISQLKHAHCCLSSALILSFLLLGMCTVMCPQEAFSQLLGRMAWSPPSFLGETSLLHLPHQRAEPGRASDHPHQPHNCNSVLPVQQGPIWRLHCPQPGPRAACVTAGQASGWSPGSALGLGAFWERAHPREGKCSGFRATGGGPQPLSPVWVCHSEKSLAGSPRTGAEWAGAAL